MFSWLSKFKKKTILKKKIFVGVSGGVDSSVSAALLRDQGYDVVGVFIRTWQPDFITCTWQGERRDAMRVCAHLQIPFIELDLEQEYKQGVADYMIAEYAIGRTPNPDVMCNREVKFGAFLTWALAHGADYIATGHYAQISGIQLVKGIDPTKDQSYFLWTLTQDQLSHILFPIGHLLKSQVRDLAEKYQLPTATKKDSQGICFIGDIDMKTFLSHYFPSQLGNVLDEAGVVIGYHHGALFFTLGERHGFTIIKKGIHDMPHYVIAKNIQDNTITVSQHPWVQSIPKQNTLIQCVWREKLYSQTEEKKYTAQIRYHGELKSCHIKNNNQDTAEIIFENPDFSLAPGQSVVVYDTDVCVGGGVVA